MQPPWIDCTSSRRVRILHNSISENDTVSKAPASSTTPQHITSVVQSTLFGTKTREEYVSYIRQHKFNFLGEIIIDEDTLIASKGDIYKYELSGKKINTEEGMLSKKDEMNQVGCSFFEILSSETNDSVTNKLVKGSVSLSFKLSKEQLETVFPINLIMQIDKAENLAPSTSLKKTILPSFARSSSSIFVRIFLENPDAEYEDDRLKEMHRTNTITNGDSPGLDNSSFPIEVYPNHNIRVEVWSQELSDDTKLKLLKERQNEQT